MDCAACRKPLKRLENREEVTAWRCGTCHAIAAELGSLAGAVSPERVTAIEKALTDGNEGGRGCPKCGAAMPRGSIRGGEGFFEVDGCLLCRIAWFDPGEIRNLRAGVTSDGEPLPSTLTPQQRRAWRMRKLRESGWVVENETDAAILGMLLNLRLPFPEPVRGSRRASLATWGVAAIVTSTSIAALIFGLEDAAKRFGLIPANLAAGGAAGLLTHFFVHADPLHLAGNLAYFVLFGTRVEALLGPPRFAGILVLATVTGGLAHAAWAPDPAIPLIGASGGVSGVLAAHASLRPRSTIRMVFGYSVVRVPAIGFFAFWIVLQLIGAGMQIAHASPVSALDHLGGAAMGLVLGFAWRARAQAVEGK